MAVAVAVTKRRRGVRGGAGHHFDDGAVAARADGGTGRRVGCPWVGWVGFVDGGTAVWSAAAVGNAIVAVAGAAAVAGRERAEWFGVTWAWGTFGAVTGIIGAGTSPIAIKPVAIILVGGKGGRGTGHGFDYVGTAAATADGVQRAIVVAVHAAVDGSRTGRWTAGKRRRARVERIQRRSFHFDTAAGGKATRHAVGTIGACWWVVVAIGRVP